MILYRFKSLRFLLIDTKVPRNTKALVAGVAVKKQNVRVFCDLVATIAKEYDRNPSSLMVYSIRSKASVMKLAGFSRIQNYLVTSSSMLLE